MIDSSFAYGLHLLLKRFTVSFHAEIKHFHPLETVLFLFYADSLNGNIWLVEKFSFEVLLESWEYIAALEKDCLFQAAAPVTANELMNIMWLIVR